MPIHPTAVVDSAAEIDPSADIGPGVIIEANVRIGAAVRLMAHCYVAWGTTLGARVQMHPFSAVGGLPQDVAFDGSPSYVTVGDDTILREGVTIHRGTTPESTTVVGCGCMLMANSHVAHNCRVGDKVVMVNSVALAGHVQVGDRVLMGGGAMAHQFVRIGELCMIRGLNPVPKDVPPFMMLGPQGVVGTNVVGMRRAGFTAAERQEIRDCHRILYRSGLHFPQAIAQAVESVRTEPGKRLAAFLQADSRRGYERLRRGRRAELEGESASA